MLKVCVFAKVIGILLFTLHAVMKSTSEVKQLGREKGEGSYLHAKSCDVTSVRLSWELRLKNPDIYYCLIQHNALDSNILC